MRDINVTLTVELGRTDMVIEEILALTTGKVIELQKLAGEPLDILVNGKRVDIPSYQVSDGDEIELKEKSRELPVVLEGIQSPERDVPDYLEVDHGKMRGRFVRAPSFTEVPYPVPMEPNLVIEFYSR